MQGVLSHVWRATVSCSIEGDVTDPSLCRRKWNSATSAFTFLLQSTHNVMLCRRRVVSHLNKATLRLLPATRPLWRQNFSSHKTRDPLRILFCGSDEFSIYSLRALNKLRERQDVIKSIDVVCRKDKSIGRGLKKIRQGRQNRLFQSLQNWN